MNRQMKKERSENCFVYIRSQFPSANIQIFTNGDFKVNLSGGKGRNDVPKTGNNPY